MPLGRAVRTIGIFLLTVAVLEIAYLAISESSQFLTVARSTAQIAALVLSMLGEAVWVDGTSLYSPLLIMRIVPECTAVTPTIVFAAAVLAFPSSVSVKLKGLLLGIVVLYLINLVRVVSLYYIGTRAPEHMEFAHIVVWQTVIVLFAIGLWSLWAVRYSVLRSA